MHLDRCSWPYDPGLFGKSQVSAYAKGLCCDWTLRLDRIVSVKHRLAKFLGPMKPFELDMAFLYSLNRARDNCQVQWRQTHLVRTIQAKSFNTYNIVMFLQATVIFIRLDL